MIRFPLFGVDIYVHWSAPILPLALIYSIKDHITFDLAGMFFAIMLMTGIIISVIAHEIGHLFAAQHLKVPSGGVRLYGVGGAAEIAEGTPREMMIVSIAGPAVSFLLFLLFGLVSLFLEPGTFAFASGVLLSFINLLNAVLNLFPVYPLDGGRIVKAYLEMKGHNKNKVDLLFRRIGYGFAGIIFLLALFTAITGNLLAAGLLVFLGGFIIKATSAG